MKAAQPVKATPSREAKVAEVPKDVAPAVTTSLATPTIVGRNVSGRAWKPKQTSRSSSLKQQPRKTWDEKKLEREERKATKEKEAEMFEARRERIAGEKKYKDAKKARKARKIDNSHVAK